ncbi:efflux RND transporter periplasmic adaptor subunit [Stenotrophomonas mori]|uniref:Efflux RND transporter periplasmic adaptor subunit n=1 Tax=Stenotrophomonas mori TaxID=2871096 RepID=A0ABT0SI53_9GAMM|nr:efflux RND transporter periplasmic adaptor subunit [Stenotrophomonas mori]MCL7714984.1 efflux RND transporter periplasmic adaptor subunit [Stenotrophomonas mori]
MKIHFAVLPLAGALLAACAGPHPSAAREGGAMFHHDGDAIVVPEQSPLGARLVVAAVQERAFAPRVDAPAAVEAEPEKLLKIVPPLAGRVVRLHRRLGDAVAAGDALATLDSPELGAAHAEHAKAQAQLQQARKEHARQRALHDEDIAAAKELEAARVALAEAEGDARAAADHLAQVGVSAKSGSRREYVLRSPIAGRVVEMEAAQGGFWNDNTAALMTVADLSQVWLTASVTERDLPRIAVGQQARIELNAWPGQAFEGEVAYIGDLLDVATRTVPVRVAIENGDGRMKPGMFARASFVAADRQALLVPATALLQNGLHTQVFVERAPGRFQPRTVTVGASAGDSVEVLSGLRAGERIVVRNGVLLND